MTDHIVLAAFGTTTAAKESYVHLQDRLVNRFPRCRFHHFSSSPTVRRANAGAAGSAAALADLVGQIEDRDNTVIQSLHVLPGREYDRLATDSARLPGRVAVGRPLLAGRHDLRRVADSLKVLIDGSGREAALLLAHGTAHPGRAAYHGLVDEVQARVAARIYFATIEHQQEPAGQVVERIARGGHRNLLLIPFLMVAGMHFFRDISGGHDGSWLRMFARHRLEVDLHRQGLALLPGIDELIGDHIEDAFTTLAD